MTAPLIAPHRRDKPPMIIARDWRMAQEYAVRNALHDPTIVVGVHSLAMKTLGAFNIHIIWYGLDSLTKRYLAKMTDPSKARKGWEK